MNDKLTHKSQDALSTAIQRAAADGSPQVDPLHLLLTLLEQEDGTTAPLLRAVGADPALVAKQAEERLARLPRARGATLSAPEMSRPLQSTIATASSRASELNDEYISTEHLLVGLAADGGEAKAAAGRGGRHARRAARGVRPDPRQRPGHQPGPRGHVQGAGEVRRRPDQVGQGRQAGPGHRPGRRDQAGHPGAVPADQEQPGADRRARRGQDRGRRGPGPADRGRRRARVAAEQAADRAGPRLDGGRGQVPRRVRGAAQGRAERDQAERRPGHHVHRRAAHGGRRGRGRGRDGRGQHAQADAGPRRAAHGRRDHAGRVPRADREGRRPGAPVPAGAGGRALGRGHDRDPARAQGALRGAPPGADLGRGAGRRGRAVRPVHHRAVPAGQGHRPGRRVRLPAPDGDRLPAGRDRRAAARRRPAARWRSSRWRTRRTRPARTGSSGCAPPWPTGRSS